MKKIFAFLLCISLVMGSVCGIWVSAASACNVSSMLAVYNNETETVNCHIQYSGTFLPNQNYVFILNNANGAQITMRTVAGTALAVADNSFSYSFPVKKNVVSSQAKPLKVTIKSTQPYVISSYTSDVVIIDRNPTVTFVGMNGTVLKSTSVDYGTAAEAPIVPQISGYEFVGWDNEFSEVKNDLTVTAIYKENKYTLTVVGGEGSGTYSYGEEVTIGFAPATDDKYIFDGWTVENGNAIIADSNAETTTVTVYGDATIRPNYTLIYKVDVVGGSIATEDVKDYYLYGDVITIIADSAETGKEFAGWEVVSGGVLGNAAASTTSLTVSGNVTVKANFVNSEYTLAVVDGIGGGTYGYGDEVTIKFSIDSGNYIFNGWTVEGNAVVADPTLETTTVVVYGSAIIRADYVSAYTVQVIGGTISVDDKAEFYPAGDVITITANDPIDGMRFEGWEIVSGSCILEDAGSATTTVTVADSDIVIKAIYTNDEYTLTVIGGEGSGIFTCDKEITITFVPDGHPYIFENWTVESGEAIIVNPTSQTTTVYIYGDTTVKANYTLVNTVEIINGAVSNEDLKDHYSANDVITITANSPADGTHFSGWEIISGICTLGDATSATTTLAVTDGRIVVEATYADDEYLLTVQEGEGGGIYNYGDEVNIYFTPATDHNLIFNGWVVENGNAVIADPTSETTTVTVYGGATIRPNYTLIYKVDVMGGSIATEDVKEYYLAGDVITITADDPTDGWQFDCWEVVVGGVLADSTAKTTELTVNGDVIVNALYVEISKDESSEYEPSEDESSEYEPSEEESSEYESSEEESSGDESSELIETNACTVTYMTVVYNNITQKVSYTVEYNGVVLPNQSYIFMLFDGNGGLISAPTVMGSQLVVDGNRFTYSYHVTSSVIADAVQPLLGSVRSAYPNVISPYQTVVSYDSTPILGDVNRDGYADNLDSAYILRYDVGLIELDEQQFAVGDVNGDGFVDSLDAAQILKYDAGIIDQLP